MLPTLVSLVDLTSLKAVEIEQDIRHLCKHSQTPLGPVAAVCVWPRWVSLCAHALRESPTAVATVVNFPHGQLTPAAVLAETATALAQGADEIDLVLPYRDVSQGKTAAAGALVAQVADRCHASGAHLKVIIESGELGNARLIRTASCLSLDNGADFIKTSTGKVPVNATVAAAEIMLECLATHKRAAGFKAAGGISRVGQAETYVQLARTILGPDAVTPARLRFGASALLDDILHTARVGHAD